MITCLLKFFPFKNESKNTNMLSQNRVSTLGFSWLRLCRNQCWILRTSQSSCLERPSNLFSSGCYKIRHRKTIFIFNRNKFDFVYIYFSFNINEILRTKEITKNEVGIGSGGKGSLFSFQAIGVEYSMTSS